MKQFIPLALIVAFILIACQGCTAKYLVNKDDCPEQAGEKYLICTKVEKIK